MKQTAVSSPRKNQIPQFLGAGQVSNSVYLCSQTMMYSIIKSVESLLRNGLAFDTAGDLFVANSASSLGPGQGSITKITPGGVQTNFASGLSTPDGLAFNSAGDLFEADNATGNIYEFTPGGARSTFASGLVYPTGLTFNSAGVLFVRNGHSIIEVTPTGAQSTVATGFGTAEGLAFQPEPDLAAIVTNGVFQVTVSMPSPYYSTIVQASTDLVIR